MKYVFFLFIFLPTLVQASPFGFSEKRLTADLEFSNSTTTKNFDDNGTQVTVFSNSLFTENRFNLASTYDFSNFWGAHALMNFKQVTSQGLAYSNSASGTGELTVGSDFLVMDDGVKIIPDFFLTIPLSPVPGTDKTAYLGEGAFEVGGLVRVAGKLWAIDNSLYGGILWRGEGLSTQIPLGLLTMTELSRKFFIRANVFGELSFNNDQYTNAPSSRTLTQIRYNGGSALYGALNPSFVAGKVAIGWNISRIFNISAGVEQTFLGVRAASETRFSVDLGFIHEPLGKKRKGSGPSSSADDKFQVDTEGK